MDAHNEPIHCEKCGNELEQDDLFCSKCGTPVQLPAEDPEPVYCASCGHELKPDSLFCPKCGTPVEVEKAETEVDEPIYCIKCGKALAPEILFCSNCGTPTSDTMETIKVTDKSPDKPKKSLSNFVFGWSIASVALMWFFPAIGYFLAIAFKNVGFYFLPTLPFLAVIIFTLIKTILAFVNKELNWKTITAAVFVFLSMVLFYRYIIVVDRYELNRSLGSYIVGVERSEREIDEHNRQIQEVIEQLNRGY